MPLRCQYKNAHQDLRIKVWLSSKSAFFYPVLPLSIHGLFSQKSSLIRSTCSVKILALLLFFLSLSFWVRLIWAGLPLLVSLPGVDICAVARTFFVDSDFEIFLVLCESDSIFDIARTCCTNCEVCFGGVVGLLSAPATDLELGTDFCSVSYNWAYEPHSPADGTGCDCWRE